MTPEDLEKLRRIIERTLILTIIGAFLVLIAGDLPNVWRNVWPSVWNDLQAIWHYLATRDWSRYATELGQWFTSPIAVTPYNIFITWCILKSLNRLDEQTQDRVRNQ
jgi:hypothetical protein